MKQELLRMENICKEFGDIRVLKNVSANVFKGETLALIGENGAGKSTLVKVLCGLLPKLSGSIYFSEKKVDIHSPQEARALGIHFIMQNPALVPNFTVAENIYMFYSCGKKRLGYNKSAIHKFAAELLGKLNIQLNPDTRARELTLSQKYLLEIAMAVSTESRLLVMDETTASLNHADSGTVKKIIEDYKKNGNSVLFISHNLEEVLEIADRVVILRDGMNVACIKRRDYSKEKIVKLLVGRDMDGVFERSYANMGREILRLENVSNSKIKNLSLTLHKGEILGVTGLIGSGKTQLANVVFGLSPVQEGKLYLYDKWQKKYKPRYAMKNRVAYIPEDRHAVGLLMNMQIEQNIVAAILGKLGAFGFIKERTKKHVSAGFINRLQINVHSGIQRIDTLSGGNQQKVILARWLASRPGIIIADEPTNGLDINSKAEVYKILNELAGKGAGILLLSSHIQEVLQMSDRVLIMKDGRIKGELERELLTRENIIHIELD